MIVVYFMMGFLMIMVLILFIGCTVACIRSCMIDVPSPPPPTKPVDVPPIITVVVHPDHRELSLAK